MLQAVNDAVDAVLAPSGWHRLNWDFVNEEIVANHAERGELAVDKLSDGIRNIIGIVADLAHRAVRLNPHLRERACVESPGIVLIDEVDMHLHPAWQQTVIASLTTAFPMIQFIVTTHSPQVLSTVDRESIRILHGDGTVTLPRYQTRGVASTYVLANAMGVDPIPDVPEWAKLRQYHGFIEQGAWQGPDAVALRTELDAHFGADHPLMLDCDRLIRFQAFKLRRSPTGQESP
jgi:predicted ATP-binding protein involved in virulence